MGEAFLGTRAENGNLISDKSETTCECRMTYPDSDQKEFAAFVCLCIHLNNLEQRQVPGKALDARKKTITGPNLLQTPSVPAI
jgi:hypothetical protein